MNSLLSSATYLSPSKESQQALKTQQLEETEEALANNDGDLSAWLSYKSPSSS